MISLFLALQVFLYPLLFLSVGGATPVKVIGIILLLLIFIRWTKGGFDVQITLGRKPENFLVYFSTYALVCQLAFGIVGIALYGELPASGGSEPALRLATQIIVSFQLYAFCYLLYEFAQRVPQLPSKAFRLSMFLMVAAGVYETLAVYVGGPAIPLTIAGGEAIVNQNLSELLGVRRTHGLAGEPRFFAVLVVMLLNALIFTAITRRTNDAYSRKRWRAMIYVAVPILLVLIFQTQSSSGLIMLVLVPLATLLIVKRSFTTTAKFALVTAIITAVFAPLLIDLFTNRVVERIQEEVISDQYFGMELSAYVDIPVLGLFAMDATDATPMVLLIEKPFLAITGLGMGNISTYVKPYLPSYGGYWGYGFTGIVEPNLGALKAILNHGLIGNMILILIFGKLVHHYRCYGTAYDDRAIFSLFLCTGSILSSYLFTAPFLSALPFLSYHAGLVTSFDRLKNDTA